jgi:putative flippase GtrA
MSGQAQLSRFLLVGGVNFVFSFLVFTLALRVLQLDHLLALLMAWLAGNLLTYVLNFIWVFRPEPQLRFGGRFVKYLMAGSVSIGANLAALYLLVDVAGHDAFWSQVAIMPFIVVFNFAVAKFWSLRKAGATR